MPQAIPYVATVVSNVFMLATGSAVLAEAAYIATTAIIKVAATALIAKALTPKQKGLASSGSQVSFKADTQAGIPIAIGRTATGGNLIFEYPFGPKNKHLNFWDILSGFGPIKAIESFKAGSDAVAFNSSGAVTTSGSKYAGKMWMSTALGVAAAAVLAQPAQPATDSSWTGYWTPAHRLSGYAVAAWDLEYDSTVYASGAPTPLWVLQGIRVYDPRLDSTYPGGIGPQRANDPDTWGFDSYENPYLHALTFCLGYWSNGKRVGGAGVAVDMIDLPAFVEGANVADANGWKIGGVITSLDSKWQVLRTMLQAGSGEPLKSGAKISCRIDTPRVSLATLTETDLAGAASITAVKSRRERKNSIIPRYRSEDHDWDYVSAAPVTSVSYQTLDGGLRQKEVEYTLCQNAVQAGQLAAYELVNSREFGPIVLSVKPAWMGYRVGDCITLNLPEKGLNGQTAIITARDLDLKTGTVSLTLTSETASKHAFALGQSTVAPDTPGLTTPDFTTVLAPSVEAFSVSVGFLTSGANALPAISITGIGDNPFAKDIIIEYRVVGTTEWIQWAVAPATTTAFTITGLDANQTYEIAVSYRSVLGVLGARCIYGPYTTGALSASQLAGVDGATIINGLNTNLAMLQKQILSLNLQTAVTKAMFYDGDGKSLKTIALNAIDTADNAVSQVNYIGVFNPDIGAFVMNTAGVIVTEDGKTWAQYADAVETKVGDLETTVAIHQESLNGISGKLSLSVTAPGGTGGIVIGAGPEGSYIALAASELAIFDNSDPDVFTMPFQINAGVITMNALVRFTGAAMIENSLTIRGVAVNTFIVPAVAATVTPVHGDGSTVFTLCATNVELEAEGIVEVSGALIQGFPSGGDNWNLWVYIDGTLSGLTSYVQGDWTQVAVPISHFRTLMAPGNHTVAIKWKGGSSVENVAATILVKGIQKVG